METLFGNNPLILYFIVGLTIICYSNFKHQQKVMMMYLVTFLVSRKTFPEHVCRYVLGVYYEINLKEQIIYLEYYRRGEKVNSKRFRIYYP